MKRFISNSSIVINDISFAYADLGQKPINSTAEKEG